MNSLPKTVTRQRRGCDLNLGPSAPESSTLTTRLPSQATPTGSNDLLFLTCIASRRRRAAAGLRQRSGTGDIPPTESSIPGSGTCESMSRPSSNRCPVPALPDDQSQASLDQYSARYEMWLLSRQLITRLAACGTQQEVGFHVWNMTTFTAE